MRVAVGALMQESNSFSPLVTDIDSFARYHIHRGADMLTGFGDARSEVPAFLSVLAAAGAEPVPLVAAYAAAGGVVTRACFDALVGEMELRLAAAGRVDALLLALHGALVVEDQPEGDAEIIFRLRRHLPPDTPVGVSLDLHGHVTRAMLQPGVFLIGYRDYPHTDIFETGQRTARLLVEVLGGRRGVPAMGLAKRPMLASPVCTRTTDGPFRPVALAARDLEAAGRVIHAGLFPVQPWIDVPDLGFAALVAAETTAAAHAAAEALAERMWQARDTFVPELADLGAAIRTGLSAPGMTLVGDAGDAPTGGAAADSPAVLRALIDARAELASRPILLTLCDPEGVRRSDSAGAGATVDLSLGHAFTQAGGVPVPVTARVLSLGDGCYRMGIGGPEGMGVAMGPSAVLGIGAIRLLLRSLPGMEWDPDMYVSQGLDPAAAALVFVKSPSHFRHSFGPLAARILVANTPGTTAPDMRRIPFRRATRPLWPLDAV